MTTSRRDNQSRFNFNLEREIETEFFCNNRRRNAHNSGETRLSARRVEIRDCFVDTEDLRLRTDRTLQVLHMEI